MVTHRRVLLPLLVTLCAAGARGEETATTGESLTLNVLAENLEEHLDEFRGTVVNSVMSLAEEKMDNLGITDAFEEAFRDDAVLGQLKTKLETGLEDMMTFFESGSPFDGIEMVTDQLEPAMDMLTGVCNQTTGRARREAALQQARAEYLQKKENRSAGNSKRTAGVLSDFASPLLTASLGVGLPGWELQLTTNWKAGLSVGGGFSLGVDTANPNQVFTGVGVGVDFSLEKGQKTCAIDADCKAKARRATICEDNKCTRVCSSAASCGPKEACDNLRCVVACDAHYDCVGLQKCDIAGTKRCQPTTACVSDSGCHVGSEVCLDNKRCVPRECTSDAQCTPGTQFCHNHRCLASECTKATEAADCTKAGEICVTRQCVPAAGQPCADAASCGLDAYCNGGLCVDKTPAPGAAMCMSNSDCSVPGETCLSGSGECGIACKNDADCGLDEGLCMFVSGSWRCVAGSSGRRAHVVSTEARKGFWKEVGDSVDISLDWFKDASSFSGFAFVVSVSNEYLRNSALHVSNLHVTLEHPHLGCLREPGVDVDAWWRGVEFAGFGITFDPHSNVGAGKKKAASASALTNLREALTNKAMFAQMMRSVKTELIAAVASTDGFGFSEAITLEDSNSGASLGYDATSCPVSAGRAAVATSDGAAAAAELVAFLEQSSDIVTKGEIVMPMCAGECGPTKTTLSSIIGQGRVGPPKTCDGVELSVDVAELTIGSVAYLATSGEVASVGSTLQSIMAPVLSMGLQDTTLAFSVTGSRLKLSAVGGVLLPETDSDFVAVLKDMAENIRVGVSASLTFEGDLELELRVGTDADTDRAKFIRVSNALGTFGAATYLRFAYLIHTGQPRQELGVSLPLVVCVEDCGAVDQKDVYFEGELSMIVTPAAQTVRGKLTAGGWYYEALKIPFVHIGNMFLGMEWDVKSPLPTGFMLGGAVCLGSRENCQNKAQPFVEGRAYVGVSASLPEDNFFVAMVTNLTIGGIAELAAQEVPWLVLLAGEASDEALAVAKAAFAALGVDVSAVTSTLEGIQQALPPQFAASGLYPYSKDYTTACPEVDADAVHTTLDMDCYAYLSFSPLKTQDIVLGTSTLTIPKGIALAGRLNFVGWEMAAEVAISTSQFYINATMDPVFIRFGNVDFLRIGSHLDGNKEAAGGARFLVDMNILPPRAEVNIQGAFDIPLLKSYGEVALVLDSEKLAFHSEINLFNGALASTADVYFPWDFTAFHMSLSDMEFLYGLVTVKQVKFDYDAAVPHPYAIFDARIDVLFAVGVEAQLKVQDDTLSFAVGLSVLGVTSTISGTAAMDTSNFLDSSFSLSVKTDINPAAVVAAVVDVAEDVAQVAKDVWDTVTTAVSDGWTFVKAQFDVPPLNYLASALGPFLDDVGGVLADIGGALMDAGLSDIVSLGHDFASGDFSALGDAVHNLAGTFGVGGSRYHREVDANEGVNEYGCRWKKVRYQTCYWTPRICAPEVCVEGYCEGGQCSGNVCTGGGCTGCCGWEVCAPEICTPEVCLPLVCWPEVCTPGACHDGFETCSGYKYGTRFPDKTCMENMAAAATAVEAKLVTMKRKNDAVVASQTANPSLASMGVPSVAVASVTLTLPLHGTSAEGTLSSSVGVLAGPCGGAGGVQPASAGTAAFNMATEAEFAASVASAQEALAASTSEVLLSKQCGLGTDILSEAGKVTYATPTLAPAADYSVLCSQSLHLPAGMPAFASVDARCHAGKVVQMVSATPLSATAFPNRVCGSSFLRVLWKGHDAGVCGGETEEVVQVVTVVPVVIASFPEDVTITNEDSLLPSHTGVPETSACFDGADITYTDVVTASQAECGVWTVVRTWTVEPPVFEECSGTHLQGVTRVQKITVRDVAGPAFTRLPEELLYVPFFETWGLKSDIPMSAESLGAGMEAHGMHSYPTTTTSKDSALTITAADAPEAQCRADGLARFTRTWTVADACGNTRTAEQIVVLQHPPAELVATQTRNLHRLFAHSTGVAQGTDVCHAGKVVTGGKRDFVPIHHGNHATDDVCGMGPWDESGCRKLAETVDYVAQVHSVAPVFATFPADTTVDLGSSVEPSVTGWPSVLAFCGTPYTLVHSDAAVVEQTCGASTFVRTWKLQPYYIGCGDASAVYDALLTTTRVQVITVRAVPVMDMLSAPGAVTAQGVCTQGHYDVSFGALSTARLLVNSDTLSTPALDLTGIDSKLQGMMAFIPQEPLVGGETVTARCCATGGCEVVIAAYSCLPCSVGQDGGISSTLCGLGLQSTPCGAHFGNDGKTMDTFRTFLEAGTELSFALNGPTEATALFVETVVKHSLVELPPSTTASLVHGIAIFGGTNVHITSDSPTLTYSPQGTMRDNMQAWGDRTYTLTNIPTELQSATYYRPSLVKSIASGTGISVMGAGWLTMYMIVEVASGRHGNFPTSLPAAGWTEVLAGERPRWGLQHEMAVYKKHIALTGVALPPSTTASLVHGIAVFGGTNVHITSDSPTLTYSPQGTMHDSMQAWGDRTYTLTNIPTELQSATYYRPSLVVDIASGTGVYITGEGVLIMYMIVEAGSGRHGNFPSSLPAAGWKEVLAGERPQWVQGVGWQHEMAVYKKHIALTGVALPPSTTASLVHGIAVFGGTNVHITSDSPTLTYSPQGTMRDNMQAWGDRTYTLTNIPTELQSATYYRPSLVVDIASGTGIFLTGEGVLTMYMIVEAGSGRHGNFPTSLPAAGWTEVFVGERPRWVQGVGWQHGMAVYKKQVLLSGPASRIPTSEWCPRQQTPFPSCVCPA